MILSREYAHDVKVIVNLLRERVLMCVVLSKVLCGQVIPEFAGWLTQKERNPTRPLDGIILRDEMHRRGINMRCLGATILHHRLLHPSFILFRFIV